MSHLSYMAVWRNGIASDYDLWSILFVESGDCRFDPCLGHLINYWLQFYSCDDVSRRISQYLHIGLAVTAFLKIRDFFGRNSHYETVELLSCQRCIPTSLPSRFLQILCICKLLSLPVFERRFPLDSIRSGPLVRPHYLGMVTTANLCYPTFVDNGLPNELRSLRGADDSSLSVVIIFSLSRLLFSDA